jgi:hypothetical protein
MDERFQIIIFKYFHIGSFVISCHCSGDHLEFLIGVSVMGLTARSTIFQLCYIVAVGFIGGGNRSTKRKSPTCRKSLTNFITSCYIEHTSL